MVFIKRIDLRGFKTFGKKVSVNLGRGLTVITGPNGSGKSNILDAVKFALGELSPKELRGATISDLIHKGSSSLSDASAHVAVCFNNGDRRIPVDSDSVTISREFRRGGEGIYRVNGKRVSRKQLTDILSSADIQVAGINIVAQHAITRLAEVTNEERRKIIEEMIGIAVYDQKKAESQVQLQQGDLNLRVASARIGEVQKRVEELERERNDLLRFQNLSRKISGLQGAVLEAKIEALQSDLVPIREKRVRLTEEITARKKRREEFFELKGQLESDRDLLRRRMEERGGTYRIEVERNIAALSQRADAVRNETRSCASLMASLRESTGIFEGKLCDQRELIEQHKKEFEQFADDADLLQTAIREDESKLQEMNLDVNAMRAELSRSAKEREDVDEVLDDCRNMISEIQGLIADKSRSVEVDEENVKMLNERKAERTSLVESMKGRLQEVFELLAYEQKRVEEAEVEVNECKKLKGQKNEQVVGALEIAKKANQALAELSSTRNVVDILDLEEKALNVVEELAEAGAIAGVLGRLGNLVKVDDGFRTAVEAASFGWMNSLVVANIQTALECIRALKKVKVGRIKIVPLEDLRSTQTPEINCKVEGFIGPIVRFVRADEKLIPALNFIFGDTVAAKTQKSAFLCSTLGYRSVTVSGDVYDPVGGMEVGHYRETSSVDEVIASLSATNELKGAVSTLEEQIVKGRNDLERIENHILKATDSRAESRNLIRTLTTESNVIKVNLSKTEEALVEIDRRLAELNARLEKDRNHSSELVKSRSEAELRLSELLAKKRSLQGSNVLEILESKHEAYEELAKHVANRKNNVAKLESKMEWLRSKISMAESNIADYERELSTAASKSRECEDRMRVLANEESRIEKELSRLAEEKTSLENAISEERKNYESVESELRNVDSSVRELTGDVERLSQEESELAKAIQDREIRISLLTEELGKLPSDLRTDVGQIDIGAVESQLLLMRKELEGIGAVNQLAIVQYEEQKNNYKQLATRIYELENEKLTIIRFMEELDRRKKEAFMAAYSEVNARFSEVFSKITGGGGGRLSLERPDDPFLGGLDVLLQFPGKSEMSVESASGGEKSVGTICFILALQAIHPVPFYMFDEVDAHLDPLNSQRLADLLRERSKGSQFVMVSLKDTAISRADCTYGVFIQEGTSKVVSLPLAKASK